MPILRGGPSDGTRVDRIAGNVYYVDVLPPLQPVASRFNADPEANMARIDVERAEYRRDAQNPNIYRYVSHEPGLTRALDHYTHSRGGAGDPEYPTEIILRLYAGQDVTIDVYDLVRGGMAEPFTRAAQSAMRAGYVGWSEDIRNRTAEFYLTKRGREFAQDIIRNHEARERREQEKAREDIQQQARKTQTIPIDQREQHNASRRYLDLS